MRGLIAGLALSALAFLTPVLAVQPDEVLNDPGLEQRARAISAGLRCLVCQNQSIDDSEAPLAKDLRILVRERLKAGDSDAEVRNYLVERYGEFVLLLPALSAHTVLLWLAPILVLGAGAAGVLLALRRRPSRSSPLTDEERASVEALLRRERAAP
jgi:cytochrome c-type biogenesis protein CcmH